MWEEIILGAPPAVAVKTASSALQPGLKDRIADFGGDVAGGVVGYRVWKKHPWLGAIAGSGVAHALSPLVMRSRKERAAALVGAVGAVGGTRYWKKHPILGFIAGSVAGSLVGSLIGSKI